ncbi:leucine-rich repeat- and IQ domain-containing protein 1 [Rhinophrynus dorsalis]
MEECLELELELSRISWLEAEGNELPADDSEEDNESVRYSEENKVTSELPESVLSCLQIVQRRSENTEKLILEDLELNDPWISQCYKGVRSDDSHSLAELASECGEEPEALRKRVLADLEEEDKKEQSCCDSLIHKNVKNFNQADVSADRFAVGDVIISLAYIEVEEKCRQKVLKWEEEEVKNREIKRQMLSAQREMLDKQIHEQDERREKRRKEFEKESSLLNSVHKEQQEKLCEELKKNNEALTEELKKHEDLIYKMQADLEKERRMFEEQKAKAKKDLEDLQNKSAVKIQAAFRAFQTYRKYAMTLKEKKEILKRKKELASKMEKERKEMEDKIKRKLEEKKRKEEEKKQKEETEKKKLEEAAMQESLKQKMRQSEYEQKKQKEKQRLEKEKQLKQELKKKQLEGKNEETVTLLARNTNAAKEDWEEEVKQKDRTIPDHPENACKSITEDQNKGHTENETKQKEIKLAMDLLDNESKSVSKQINITHMETEKTSITNSCADNKLSFIQEDQTKIVSSNSPQPLVNDISSCKQNTDPSVQISSVHVGGHNDFSSRSSQGSELQLYLGSISTNGIVATQEETPDIAQDKDSVLSISERSLVLPDHIEEKRLTWMKTCKPWSKILRESQRKKSVKKTRQRKSSASKNLPLLKEDLLLQNSPWHDLRQVTTVTLQDLPGCSLTTLSACAKLQYLSLRRCGLIALEGLSNCKELRYIDAQENSIQVICCEDLENLCVLLLNKNQITSIHGIDNCKNLMNVELSFNSITRIGELDSLRNLQRLVLDHNQLISTKGLETTPALVYLDCSYNYLTEVEGIQNCVLLQILKLQGNSLSEAPKLDNHVLLRELHLEDNNISTLHGISLYWLPLLQVLKISQNSLVQLAPLNSFISLEELDISNNCLSDVNSVILWLQGCVILRRLSLNKNPLLQESNWRCTLLKLLPGLRYLNDEYLNPEEGHSKDETQTSPVGSFWALCQAQIHSMCKLWQALNSAEGRFSSLDGLECYCHWFKELIKHSTEHRYAHEYGDTGIGTREYPESMGDHLNHPAIDSHQHNNLVISGAHENKQEDATRQITSKQAYSLLANSSVDLKKRDEVKNPEKTNMTQVRVKCGAAGNEAIKDPKCTRPVKNKAHSAAIVIQSHWRGYAVRREIHYYARLHEAATVIQSAWRHHCTKINSMQKKTDTEPDMLGLQNMAATVIQAVWKGFYLRKKLAAAFAAIERDEVEDDFEEVNLDEFTFDENALEKEWTLDSTNFPTGTPHFSSKPERPKIYMKDTVPENKMHSFPWPPHQAWQYNGTEKEDSDRLEKQSLSHVSSMKSCNDISSKSEKEEKISQEWGFKDSSTAQLMLKRAQKMKSKRARNKKMLDPAVRLALFKNNENKHLPVKPPKKIQTIKTDYFQGNIEELVHLNEDPSEALARSREFTYQWLHTQCSDSEASSVIKCKSFLPELNHDILNGGRVQLVANIVSKKAVDLDMVSVNSGSALIQNREKNKETHRHSAGSSDRDLCAPMKINSGPQKKERISFRDNPLQLSGGWGRGKKRGK